MLLMMISGGTVMAVISNGGGVIITAVLERGTQLESSNVSTNTHQKTNKDKRRGMN